MKTPKIAAVLALAIGLFNSQLSEAQQVVVRVNPRPRPVVVVPARPVYVAPRRGYAARRRVYVAPRPVVVVPARPVYVTPRPVYVAPRRVVVAHRPYHARRR